jgi:hypothetical protein
LVWRNENGDVNAGTISSSRLKAGILTSSRKATYPE